jgi:hypothetical protein
MTDRPGATAPPVTGSGPPSELCEPDEYLNVDGPWGRYVLKNNDFHPTTAPECITHYGTGAEVMIWLSARGFAPVRATHRIDGIGWSLVHWRTRSLTQPQDTWPLIIFRAARSRTSSGWRCSRSSASWRACT